MAYTPTSDFIFSGGAYTPTADFTFDDGGIPPQTGTLAYTLDDATGSFIAAIAPQGTIAAQTDDAVGSFSGYVQLRGQISANTDDTVGAFIGRNVTNRGTFSAVLDDTVGGMIGNYDANVTRWITSLNLSQQENTTKLAPVANAMSRDQATRTDHLVQDEQQDAIKATTRTELSNANATPKNIEACSSQDNTIRLRLDNQFVREQGTFVDLDICIDLEQASDTRINSGVVMEQMTKVYPDRWEMRIQDSGVVIHDFLRPIQLDPPEPYLYTPGLNFTFNNSGDYTPEPSFQWTYGQIGYLATGHNYGVARNSVDSTWSKATGITKIARCVPVQEARKPPRGKSPWIDIPRPEPDPTSPTGETTIIPVLEVYTMINSAIATLEDLTEIHLNNIKLNFDADSFTWDFSATLLDHNQLALIKPLNDGTTIKLIITINGKVFHVFVEAISHKRTFGERSISISGRSLSALLASPYQLSTTGLQGSLLSVAQLADLHLPPGWTINWSSVTWNVTAGAYSYQNRTPIEAITDLALAMGAMVVPATDSQTLTIMPRYPVLPWNFASTNVDVAIPEDVILELTHRQTSQKYANGIYIHGGDIGGVLGFCRLNGTAGDVLLQTVSNPIMTDVIGIRAAAERYLAAEYTQPDISSVKTFMDGTTVPFIDVGTLVGVTVDSVQTKAIVSGVSIEATTNSEGVLEVSQELSLGEDSGNSWIAFKSLLPSDPLLVGTIQSTDGTTSIIQLIDGGTMNVRGTGTVSNKVYIRSGQIQGDAPNMVQNDIVI